MADNVYSHNDYERGSKLYSLRFISLKVLISRLKLLMQNFIINYNTEQVALP